MSKSAIEWTEMSWNPITGCNKVSEGCKNCYAEVMSRRLKGMGQQKYKNEFELTLHENVLKEPYKWKKPHTVFVCSMSDLFHEKVPFDFIDKVFQTIEQTPHHQYQVLTKRAERMNLYFQSRHIPENAWLGVTVENKKSKERIEFLRPLQASVLFLSCEPLLEDLEQLDLTNIDWIIVGGESGPKARPMKEDWVLSIKEQSQAQGAAFFFKQWGTWGSDGVRRSKQSNGKLLQGKVYQELPIK